MAKLIITFDIPNENFDPIHYPLDDPTPKEMLEFDIKQVNTNVISLDELLGGYLDSGIEPEIEVQ